MPQEADIGLPRWSGYHPPRVEPSRLGGQRPDPAESCRVWVDAGMSDADLLPDLDQGLRRFGLAKVRGEH